MTVAFGLFDNLLVDPLDTRSLPLVLSERLDDLAYAESLGFWGYFTTERHFWKASRAVSPAAWIAAAARQTRIMRLGVLGYSLPLHSPALIAEEVAFLDQLSGGRFELGVSPGDRPTELEQLGIDLSTAIPRFQEQMAILQGMLSGGVATVTSDFHHLANVASGVLPAQQPHPPIWFTGSEMHAAIWAGANGHHLAIGSLGVKDLLPVTVAYRAARAEQAKQPEHDHLALGGKIALIRRLYLADTTEAAHREMAEDIYRLNALALPVQEGSRTTRREEAAAEVTRLIDQQVFVAGGPDTVVRQLRFAHQALGFDLFLAHVYAAGIDQERVRRTMHLLATDVAPQLTVAV